MTIVHREMMKAALVAVVRATPKVSARKTRARMRPSAMPFSRSAGRAARRLRCATAPISSDAMAKRATIRARAGTTRRAALLTG